MKNKIITTIAGILSALTISVPTYAENPTLSGSAVINVSNIFVGKDGPVLMRNPVAQSNFNGEISFSKFDVSSNLWTNYDFKKKKLSELDWSLGVKKKLGGYTSLFGGLTGLYFPNGFANHTAEIYFGITTENNIANITGNLFYDFVDGNGALGLLRVDHPIDFLEGKVTLIPSVTLGYNNNYFQKINQISHGIASLEAVVEINEMISVSGIGSYQQTFSNNNNNNNNNNNDTELFGGIALTLRTPEK